MGHLICLKKGIMVNLYMTLPNKFVSETTCYIPSIYLLYIIITPPTCKGSCMGIGNQFQHPLVSRCTLPDSAVKGNVRMTLEMPRPKGCIVRSGWRWSVERCVFFASIFSFNVELGQEEDSNSNGGWLFC